MRDKRTPKDVCGEVRGELEVMGRRKTGIDLVRDLTQLFKAPSAQLLYESGSASCLTFLFPTSHHCHHSSGYCFS